MSMGIMYLFDERTDHYSVQLHEVAEGSDAPRTITTKYGIEEVVRFVALDSTNVIDQAFLAMLTQAIETDPERTYDLLMQLFWARGNH